MCVCGCGWPLGPRKLGGAIAGSVWRWLIRERVCAGGGAIAEAARSTAAAVVEGKKVGWRRKRRRSVRRGGGGWNVKQENRLAGRGIETAGARTLGWQIARRAGGTSRRSGAREQREAGQSDSGSGRVDGSGVSRRGRVSGQLGELWRNGRRRIPRNGYLWAAS